jgi:hypothetical protein
MQVRFALRGGRDRTRAKRLGVASRLAAPVVANTSAAIIDVLLGSSAMFHHDWVTTTGRVLDSRIRTMYHTRAGGEIGGPSIPLHNYIVEFRAPDGETVKLEVEQHIETVELSVGSDAPLLVSPDGKKAVFDKHDPRISVSAVQKAAEQADTNRFREHLQG